MSGFKVVPMEPTAEMVEAAQDAYMPFGDMDIALRMAVLAAPAVQGEPVANTFYVLHDATEGQKYIRKNSANGCLAIFEREGDAQRAKRRHPGTEYKRVDYYTAPQLAVHGEPVAWVTADTVDGQTVNGKPRRIWWENKEGVGIPIYTAPQTAPNAPAFQLGDHVRKTKGSQWKGRVVGTYSTSLTPEGYAVESDTEKGSVQIYPVGALELVAAHRKGGDV